MKNNNTKPHLVNDELEQEVVTNDVAIPADTLEDNIVDIDLSETAKKPFRIDGDNNRIIHLNTSDIGMISRLDEAEQKLNEIQDKIAKLRDMSADDSANISEIGKALKDADKEMRKLIDFIFDSPVSQACAPNGTMYDPFGGRFRYEFVIDRLIPLYEKNLSHEASKISAKAKSYTKKYLN